MNGDDAASPGPWSRRIQRAILPIGVLLLTTWVLFTGYGVISGEMTLGPATVVGAILFLGSVISTIWVGWSLRSRPSSREERRTDSFAPPDEVTSGSRWP